MTLVEIIYRLFKCFKKMKYYLLTRGFLVGWQQNLS